MNSLDKGLVLGKPAALRPRAWLGLAAWLAALVGWVVWSQWLPPLLAVPAAVVVAGAAAVVCVGGAELASAVRVVRSSFQQGLRDPRETLETVMLLSEHSRRNGIVGLADVETNWAPLAMACHLVATAADDARIRQEGLVAARATRQRSDGAILVLALSSVCVVVTGACLFVLSQLGGDTPVLVGWAALAASLLFVAVVLLPAIARLAIGRSRELVCLSIVFEGAVHMLHDNSMESVYRELEAFIPGGLVAD